MPDNVEFDAAQNLYICEDKSATPENPNRIVHIDRASGKVSTFAEVVNPADESTGPAFAPGGRAMFLNLQRSVDFGVTLVIEGPFPRRRDARGATAARLPKALRPEEARAVRREALWLPSLRSMSAAEATALVSLHRRGRLGDLPGDLGELALDLRPPGPVANPKRR
jgi:secreted PhoX family phosphatase